MPLAFGFKNMVMADALPVVLRGVGIYEAIRKENEQASSLSCNPIGAIHPEDRPSGGGKAGNAGTRIRDSVQ